MYVRSEVRSPDTTKKKKTWVYVEKNNMNLEKEGKKKLLVTKITFIIITTTLKCKWLMNSTQRRIAQENSSSLPR